MSVWMICLEITPASMLSLGHFDQWSICSIGVMNLDGLPIVPDRRISRLGGWSTYFLGVNSSNSTRIYWTVMCPYFRFAHKVSVVVRDADVERRLDAVRQRDCVDRERLSVLRDQGHAGRQLFGPQPPLPFDPPRVVVRHMEGRGHGGRRTGHEGVGGDDQRRLAGDSRQLIDRTLSRTDKVGETLWTRCG